METDKRIRDIIVKTIFNDKYKSKGIPNIMSIYYKLKRVESREKVNTAGVCLSTMTLYINPDFVEEHIGSSNEKLLGLTLHEIMHVLCFNEKVMPIYKIKNLNFKLANIAQDIVINNIIYHKMNIKLPEVGLIPQVPDTMELPDGTIISNISDKSWIDIYYELQNKNADLSQISNDEGAINLSDIENMSEISNKIESICGELQQSLGERNILSNIIPSSTNWRNKLFRKIQNHIYAKLIKRTTDIRKKPYIAYKDIVYNKTRKGLKGVVVVDVSGSMPDTLIGDGLSILYRMLKDAGGELFMISFSTRKVEEKKVKSQGMIKENLALTADKGGTDIRKMLDILRSGKADIKILITDMEDTVDIEEYKFLDILITNKNIKGELNNVIVV